MKEYLISLDDKDAVKNELSLINEKLAPFGIQINLRSTTGGWQMTTHIPDSLELPPVAQNLAKGPDAVPLPILTLEEYQRSRFYHVPMQEVAKSVGVSVSTLYNRSNAAFEAKVPLSLPFFAWP